MVQVTHHTRLSVIPEAAYEEPIRACHNATRAHGSKFLERQVILAWKCVTRAVRKPQRASILPANFIMITATAQAKRRSALLM